MPIWWKLSLNVGTSADANCRSRLQCMLIQLPQQLRNLPEQTIPFAPGFIIGYA